MLVDLRSDTVTQPTAAMRRAMFEAEVGDDVYGEDPTLNALEELAARVLGKEAAVFVPSGVMANQLAVKTHTQPGTEVVLESRSHIFRYENGAAGMISGVQLHIVEGARGILQPEQVDAAIRRPGYGQPVTSLVCLENTHNVAGGIIYPQETIAAIADVARQHNARFHLDGARLWNAAVASGVSPATIAAPFDTVSACLSKGLGAPVGSVLAGSAPMIDSARTYRKMLGGGMRQAGVLGAAGIHALQHHVKRLDEDHVRARQLAEGLAALPGFEVDVPNTQTNIVLIHVAPSEPESILQQLKAEGILLSPFGPTTLRATTHLDVSDEAIDHTLSVANHLFASA